MSISSHHDINVDVTLCENTSKDYDYIFRNNIFSDVLDDMMPSVISKNLVKIPQVWPQLISYLIYLASFPIVCLKIYHRLPLPVNDDDDDEKQLHLQKAL